MRESISKTLSKAIRWESALLLVVILELAVFGVIKPEFLSIGRIVVSTSDFVYLGITALPLAMIMLTAGIDISFASIASLGGITAGVVYSASDSMVTGVIVGLIAGLLCGLLNGALIAITKAQPMVITLGTQFLFAGLALGVSGLGGVSAFEGISGLPKWFTALTNGKIIGIPNMFIIFIVFSILFWLFMSNSVFGRHIRLIGVNPNAAKIAGIPITKITLMAYSTMGIVSALVGILLTSYVGSARPDIGASLLMPTLTLVVIGGVSMFGGEGSMVGVIIATFVIGFLQQGLRFLGLSENEVAVATGTVLVLVASLRWWSGYLSESYRNNQVQKKTQKYLVIKNKDNQKNMVNNT